MHLLAEEVSQVMEVGLESARSMFEDAVGEDLN
jgi:CarD family transcriptional regulator